MNDGRAIRGEEHRHLFLRTERDRFHRCVGTRRLPREEVGILGDRRIEREGEIVTVEYRPIFETSFPDDCARSRIDRLLISPFLSGTGKDRKEASRRRKVVESTGVEADGNPVDVGRSETIRARSLPGRWGQESSAYPIEDSRHCPRRSFSLSTPACAGGVSYPEVGLRRLVEQREPHRAYEERRSHSIPTVAASYVCEAFGGLPPFRPLSRAALALAPLRLRPSNAPRPTRPTSGFDCPLR